MMKRRYRFFTSNMPIKWSVSLSKWLETKLRAKKRVMYALFFAKDMKQVGQKAITGNRYLPSGNSSSTFNSPSLLWTFLRMLGSTCTISWISNFSVTLVYTLKKCRILVGGLAVIGFSSGNFSSHFIFAQF